MLRVAEDEAVFHAAACKISCKGTPLKSAQDVDISHSSCARLDPASWQRCPPWEWNLNSRHYSSRDGAMTRRLMGRCFCNKSCMVLTLFEPPFQGTYWPLELVLRSCDETDFISGLKIPGWEKKGVWFKNPVKGTSVAPWSSHLMCPSLVVKGRKLWRHVIHSSLLLLLLWGGRMSLLSSSWEKCCVFHL